MRYHNHYSMLHLIEGAWVSSAIYAVIQLGIPDLLVDQPLSSRELARATRTHEPALYRLMRALAHEGLFDIHPQKRFSLTAVGATLRTGAPDSLHDWALLMLGPTNREAWTELAECARTGQSAFKHRFDTDLWSYRSENVDYAKLFDAGMASFTRTYVHGFLATCCLSGSRTIVDVGCGDGSLLLGILHAYPEASGILFDLPEALSRAKNTFEKSGLETRYTLTPGDAFVQVPTGGDVYILSRVVHDWDDDDALRILIKCREALPSSGRILVIERILPDSDVDFPDSDEESFHRSLLLSDLYLTDLNMMVMTKGRERSLREYRALLRDAGLELVSVIQTGTSLSVLETQHSDETRAARE